MSYIVIKTTFESKKDAEAIARKIIDANLAACTQLSEIESYYRWNNKTENTHEYKLEIKTLDKNYKKIEELIIKNHKYKIPEIIAYKISKGSKKYLNWMKNEIK
jgi:periplasmic divalent cation tolerance protein